MGVSHVGGIVGVLGAGIDLDALHEARIRMLRELERLAAEKASSPEDESLLAIREQLLEAEAELDH
jgi:hypothetical protein